MHMFPIEKPIKKKSLKKWHVSKKHLTSEKKNTQKPTLGHCLCLGSVIQYKALSQVITFYFSIDKAM